MVSISSRTKKLIVQSSLHNQNGGHVDNPLVGYKLLQCQHRAFISVQKNLEEVINYLLKTLRMQCELARRVHHRVQHILAIIYAIRVNRLV